MLPIPWNKLSAPDQEMMSRNHSIPFPKVGDQVKHGDKMWRIWSRNQNATYTLVRLPLLRENPPEVLENVPFIEIHEVYA